MQYRLRGPRGEDRCGNGSASRAKRAACRVFRTDKLGLELLLDRRLASVRDLLRDGIARLRVAHHARVTLRCCHLDAGAWPLIPVVPIH